MAYQDNGSPLNASTIGTSNAQAAATLTPTTSSGMIYIQGFTLSSDFASTSNVLTETSVPATIGSITLYTGPGELIEATVTATGSATLTFQDGAGNVIAEVTSAATVGQTIQFNAAFGTSLVANKSASTPAVTVTYTPLNTASGNAATTAILSGVKDGPFYYRFTATTNMGGQMNVSFPDPKGIAAQSRGGAITMTVPAMGTGIAVAIDLYGYQL